VVRDFEVIKLDFVAHWTEHLITIIRKTLKFLIVKPLYDMYVVLRLLLRLIRHFSVVFVHFGIQQTFA
jgi:hypothetical protein